MSMRSIARLVCVALVTVASVSCGDVVTTGKGPYQLVIDSLTGVRGGGTGAGAIPLLSDVITNMTSPPPCAADNPCPTVFNDVGSAQLRLVAKDPLTGSAPTPINDVTIRNARIVYRRTDGRNTPGVDVPYPFDAAATVTVPAGGSATIPFEIVRHTAKSESPLVQLKTNGIVINTIAEITFYGIDQAGNEISVTGLLQVDFANFGD